ncbi:MAG TPA: SIMPL domain-containing protein, partial [Patescibacteria group bacterium]|nr:SIMPL domain-containing protein [Patescibacteria group bacterium]
YTEGTDVKTAQTQNTDKVNAIIKAVKALGVSDADVQTSNYSINPKFDWNNGKQTLLGYSVTQTVTVKIRDLSKVGEILAKAGELGANQVNGVNFSIDDPSKIQQEARKKAIDDAREKADELASSLGLHVVRVVNFSEMGNNPIPIMPYAKSVALGMGGGAAPAPDIQSGSLDVTSNVSITFEIQ